MKKLIKIKVFGRVQGVGFRFSSVETANKYGITGIVRNEPDDTVYIEAEGVEENLVKFISWCHKGPSWAKVTEVKIADGNIKDYQSFEIVR